MILMYYYYYYYYLHIAYSIKSVLIYMTVVFVGSRHGYNWNFACVQSHNERRLTGNCDENKFIINAMD